MAVISSPTKNLEAETKPVNASGIFEDAKGRVWTTEAIDELVVGRTHGNYTFTPATIYLSQQPNLSKITADEAAVVFEAVVQRTEDPFTDWSSKPVSDAAVQEILWKINGIVADARKKYLSNRH